MYGYWGKQEEDPNGLVSRIDGFAKIAGIVGVGLASRPMWSKLAGKVAAEIGQSVAPKLSSNSIQGFIKSTMGDEFTQPFVSFHQHIRKYVATSLSNQHRTNVFLDGLENYVEGNSKQAFRDSREQILPMLQAVGKVNQIEDSEVESVILNPDAIDYLTRNLNTMGIKLNSSFKGNERRVFEELISKTSAYSPTEIEINKTLSGQQNQKALLEAFEHLHANQQKRLGTVKSVVALPDHVEEITFGRLVSDDTVGSSVEEYMYRLGLGHTLDKENKPLVGKLVTEINQYIKGNKSAFVDDPDKKLKRNLPSKQLKEVQDKLQAALESTTTGLVRDKRSGEVYSLANVRSEKTNLINNLLDELQIPLVPFKFNVPLSTFKQLSPTNKSIRYLGNIANDPEIRRELQRTGSPINTTMLGLGIDDKLLTLTHGSYDAQGNLISPGEMSFKNIGNKRLVSYEKRSAANVKRLADARGQHAEDFNLTLRDFGGAEDNHSASFKRKVFSNMPNLVDIAYDETAKGYRVIPKNDNLVAKAMAPYIKKAFPDITPVTHLHPQVVANYLRGHQDITKIDPDLYRHSVQHVIRQVSRDRADISGLLRNIGEKVNSGELEISKSDYDYHLLNLAKSSDNPSEIVDIIGREVGVGTKAQSLSHSNLFEQGSPNFYRAIMSIMENEEDLFDVTQGQSGFLNQTASDLWGQTGIGQLMERFQTGLLSEFLRKSQVATLDKEAYNLSGKSLLEELKEVSLRHSNSQHLGGLAVTSRLQHLGLVDETGMGNAGLDSLLNEVLGVENIIPKQLDKFAAASMLPSEQKKFLDLTSDVVTKAKIIDDTVEALNSFESLKTTTAGINQRQSQILYMMQEHLGSVEAVATRFTKTRPWYPENPSLDPLNINNFYSVFSDAPSLSDWAGDFKGSLTHQIRRQFGIPDFARSMVDPETPLGSVGAATQMLITMPQNVANAIGMGLPGQDRLTALRTMIGFYGKRVLPLIVANEAYQNFNADMHNHGLPGIDDLSANLLANINLNAAGIKDALGITAVSQQLVNTLPGLDQYFSPRTREEYEEYLKYGEEAVREGRGWIIGSRGAYMGGKVKWMRPNFYRRWKSHWTEADNVDIANPNYSFLPTLSNPLAPLSVLINPDWWVEKHRHDRPYIPGGNGYAPDRDPTGNFFSINSDPSSNSPLAIGELGGGYATVMGGGGQQIQYDISNKSLFTGAQGSGGKGGFAGSGRGLGFTGTGVYPGAKGGAASKYLDISDPISITLNKFNDPESNPAMDAYEVIKSGIDALRIQAGLYGAVLQRSPFYPGGADGLSYQEAKNATSFNRMFWSGEYGEMFGPVGIAAEFFRRFIQPNDQSYDAYNPLPNNMPSWLPSRFHRGDPYTRTPGIGELQLPGDALERIAPWIRPMKVRGSSIGMSEKELIQKWLNPIDPMESSDAEDIVDFGSEAHKQAQLQMRRLGILVGAEVSIFDKENNLSGTMDAVVRGANGMEIVEVKTQGQKSWGSVPDKYIDQINFYMANTGIDTGNIVFINRDNPTEVRNVRVQFDPNRWKRTLDRIERARATMTSLVDKGLVSPFETYDLVSRIEVLARTAPESAEFREHLEFAQKGGLGGFEKQRVDAAIKAAELLTEEYDLYSRRYNRDLVSARLNVESIGSNGEILTNLGTVKLAGVDLDPQALAIEGPAAILSRFGIQVGQNIMATIQAGALNPEVMADRVTPVIVGDVNANIIKSQYGKWDDTTQKDPIASQARYGNNLLGAFWENLVHSDNLITNKFLRVRSALEQFERGEVYGTDKFKWEDPIETLVLPTINSFTKKDPITASLQMGTAFAMFARTNSSRAKIPFFRSKMAMAGAALGGLLSVGRSIYKASTDEIWTPERYRHQASFDEYWDTLTYLKYTAVAEKAKSVARAREGVDIDKLQASGERETVGLGPYSIMAINAERKAKRTMYGFNVASGTLQDAVNSLPRRQQQIAEEIITNGSLEEKQRFYDLLPDAQRRVLGKFLNVETPDLPRQQNLEEYFKTHFLPALDWKGWDQHVDINDLKTRAADVEGVKIEKPSRQRVAKARNNSRDIPIPRMDHTTYADIQKAIRNLLASGGWSNMNVNFNYSQSDSSVINVDMKLFEDQTSELIEQYKREI